MTARLALSFVLCASPVSTPAVPALAEPAHSDEIQAYALLAATAQIVSDRCADILVNNDMIQSAPSFFHMTPEDEQSARLAYGIEMKRLGAAIDAAPSLKAWCDAAFLAYGPKGEVLKGLLAR